MRSEIDVIDYVRDRTDADVHVLVTSQATGGGGEHFDVAFIGLRRFAGVEHTLSYLAPKASTDDERRRGLAEVFKRGLVRYLADTAIADRISIEFAPPGAVTTTGAPGDRWNLWVFSMNVGGSFNGERSSRGGSISGNGTANRTSGSSDLQSMVATRRTLSS